ncbi:chemotaxis protein CheB [Chroococcidiopsis sp. TS-821]|uniref:chemotaxis protein CheB n=1 Tax=Chroococcidiopsis sp. TS-821 TaxID=1378066 RepID=UPI000CEE420E|nr:chemotaxis protein CheB [Chroococcidiopsis sp. TS-821]PPS45348.1 chemotaxis protein CheB [Chroococcidiopsis sp. TS-821]
MSGCDIIVVGASAGGVEALEQLIRHLPTDLPAAIFVVLHIPAQGTSVLPSILNRCIQKQHKKKSLLKAVHPQDGAEIQQNHIYVAPPDYHLLVKNGYLHLARGPRENSHRPAVDPLFRTAARVYGKRVVGVVLSGTLDDGTAGLAAIKQQGGIAIAQDPEEALYSGMPRSAIENVAVDHILPVAKIAAILVELANQPIATEVQSVSRDMNIEADMAELELGAMQNLDRPGKPSAFGCPECGGVLWELNEGNLTRFRCRTGHAYSSDSLLAEQSEALEEALWNALRALEEKAALSQRLATQARTRNQPYSAKRFQTQGEDAQAQAKLVRNLLLKGEDNGHLSTVNGQIASSIENATPVTQAQSNENLKASTTFPVVAIGASAGGLKALGEVLSSLCADFPAAITVVQHLYPYHSSQIANILNHRTALTVKEAEQNEQLQPGKVYIAPPNKHLLVTSTGTLCLSDAQMVHFVRPSVDLLFESVAASFQTQAIAVVLTGMGSDGAMGVRAIKQMGGKAIAQDRASADFFGMPSAAIETGEVDFVVPLQEIATILMRLVTKDNL